MESRLDTSHHALIKLHIIDMSLLFVTHVHARVHTHTLEALTHTQQTCELSDFSSLCYLNVVYVCLFFGGRGGSEVILFWYPKSNLWSLIQPFTHTYTCRHTHACAHPFFKGCFSLLWYEAFFWHAACQTIMLLLARLLWQYNFILTLPFLFLIKQ